MRYDARIKMTEIKCFHEQKRQIKFSSSLGFDFSILAARFECEMTKTTFDFKNENQFEAAGPILIISLTNVKGYSVCIQI